MVGGYTAKAAARIVGINYGTLDYWARTGFIEPSIVQSEGRGTSRVYSFLDLVALKVASELRRKGISLQALRDVVTYLHNQEQEIEQNPLTGKVLVVEGKRVFIVKDECTLVDVMRGGQLVWAMALGETVEKLKQATKADSSSQKVLCG